MIRGIASCDGPVRNGSAQGFRLHVGDVPVTVVARTLVECDEHGWHYRGLRFTLATDCESVDRAAAVFETALQTVMGLISVTTSAEPGRLRLHLIYEEAKEGEQGELIVYGFGRHSELTLRKVYWTHLSPLFVFMSAADESTSRRLETAFRWFGRAVEQGDPVDRFTSFWVALESLNVLLERKWGLEPEDRTCPHCDESLGKRHALYGIERLLRSIPEGGADFERRVRKLRNGILHGYEDLRVIAAAAAELSDGLGTATLRAIANVCGWNQDVENNFARSPLPAPPPFQVLARLRYSRNGKNLGLDRHHPIAEVSYQEIVTHDAQGEPAGVEYEATVAITASQDMTVDPHTLHCWVASRTRGPVPVHRATLRHTFEAGLDHGQQPKGVTLWEIGDDDVWYPDPKTLGARGERA